MKPNLIINIIRWSARIIGTLIVAFTLLIVIGETLESCKGGNATSETFNALMIITFSFWGAGLASLILALWNEGLGGFVSLLCFMIFILLIGVNPKPDVYFSIVLFIYLLPSVLYLFYWWLKREFFEKNHRCKSKGVDGR
ncbi:MAG: hypothetical protein WDZ80_04335 [Candidatus Paceibacterota bacterium]